MNNWTTKKKAILILVILGVIFLGAALAVSAWLGPEERETFTTENPAPYVTLNAITDNPVHGDERNFSQVRLATASNETYQDSIVLEEGKEYVVYIYYRNGADEAKNLIAEDVTVQTILPGLIEGAGGSASIESILSSSNAKPEQVSDTVELINEADIPLTVAYVPGSATIHNFGLTNGVALPDEIASSGTAIGFDALDGQLAGGSPYAGYITYRFVVGRPAHTVSAEVRKAGGDTWEKEVSASSGDTIDLMITFSSEGTLILSDVVLSLEAPEGAEYIPGSTWVVNSSSPDGVNVSDKIVEASGINISDYAPGARAYIKASFKITATTPGVIRFAATATTAYESKTAEVPVTIK